MPNKVQPKDHSKTGVMPRVELEPKLHHEAPPPITPEMLDDDHSKTGEMPAVTELSENLDTGDEDAPNGK